MSDGDDFFADTVLPEAPRPIEASVQSAGPVVGEDPIPADLNRFNVSAFMWGAWWSLAYGLWPRLLLQLGLAVVNATMLAFLPLLYPGWPRSPLDLAPQAIMGLVIVGVNAWLAKTANARVWENGTRRLSGVSVMTFAKSARGSVDRFRKVQKDWTLVGFAFWGLVVLQPLLLRAPASFSALRLAGSMVTSVAMFMVGLTAWLLLRRQNA